MKTVLGHIPRVASCTHNTPVQLRLPFHTPECGQGAAIPIPHYVVLQYTVQLCWCPPPDKCGDASPHLSGRFFLSNSRRSTAALCTSGSSDSGMDRLQVIIFHSMHCMSTSTIWSLGSDTWHQPLSCEDQYRFPRGQSPSASKGRSYFSVRPQSTWEILGYPRLC